MRELQPASRAQRGISAAGGGIRRHEFSTADPEVARRFLLASYGGLLLSSRASAAPLVTIAHVDAGDFSHADLTLHGDLAFRLSGQDVVIVSTVRAGRIEAIRPDGTLERYQPGDVFVGNCPQADVIVRTYHAAVRGVLLPVSLLRQVAGSGPGDCQPPLTFAALQRSGPQLRAHWIRATQYVEEVLASPAIAAAPLVISAAARLLASTALHVFPSGLTAAPDQPERAVATAALRRALTFIDEHAAENIGVAEVAAAAYLSPRAVQLAFRQQLGTTPMAYLRRVRLDHAHRELVAGDPATDSVTSVAARWGFASPSRFAAYYLRAYGVAPRQTLRDRG